MSDRDGQDTFLFQWGGRKFILSVGTALIATLLVWFEKIDGTVFATVILATVGAFITGNVVATLAESKVKNGMGPQARREAEIVTTTTETKVEK